MYAPTPYIVRAMAAGLAFAAGLGTAHAFDEPRTVQVRYDDLDLSAPRGVDRLKTRVRAAASRVCRVTLSTSRLQENMLRNACMKETLARADRDVEVAIANQGNRRYAGRQVIGVGTR